MPGRKYYALISITSFAVFVAIFSVHYYAYVSTGTVERVKMEFSAYRYLVEVYTTDNCTFYLPVPGRNGEVMKFNPYFMEVPENWSWSITATPEGKMLRLNVTGNGVFEVHLYPDKPVNTKHPEYLLEPRHTNTTSVYSSCLANVHIEIVGENHWYEYAKLYWWTKRTVRCECYKNWVDANIETAGWIEVNSRLETEKECHGGCLMCIWCR